MNFASASLLAQSRPSGTTAVTAYTASIRTEITLIYIANTTGSPAAYSVYHDDGGTTFDATTALHEANSLAANTSTTIRASDLGGGVTVNAGGSLGIKTGTSNALTFSVYGVTANIQGVR